MSRVPYPYRNGELVIVIDCGDLERSARFWSEALGYVADPPTGDYQSLFPADGNGIEVLLQQIPDKKNEKNRLHLDLRTPDLEAEIARLTDLGATVLTEPIEGYGWRWHVLADPYGNEFCVIRPPVSS